MLSRDNESLKEFRERVISVFPYTEGYHHQFSEFKEIWLPIKSIQLLITKISRLWERKMMQKRFVESTMW